MGWHFGCRAAERPTTATQQIHHTRPTRDMYMTLTATPKTKKTWTPPVIHKVDLNAANGGTRSGTDGTGGHTLS